MSRCSTSSIRQLFIVLFLSLSYTAFATIEIVSTNLASANGTCNGSIRVRANGSAGAFEIMAIGPTTSQPLTGVNSTTPVTIEGLCAGTYEVVFTNRFGCATIISTVVGQCASVTLVNATSTIQHPSQCGASNGSINLTGANFTGGISPYVYKWSNGATTSTISNLPSGTYTLTVTDGGSCPTTHQFVLQAPNEIRVNENITPTCSGSNNGSISIFLYTGQIPGGGGPDRGPYTFRWSNGAVYSDVPGSNPTSRIDGLAAGNYSVTIEDFSPTCQDIIKTFTVPGSSSAPFVVNGTIENTCPEEPNGAIQLQINGGEAPYQIYWDGSSSQGGDRLSNLRPGSHCARVIDRCGTTINKCFEIPLQQNLVFDVTTTKFQHASPTRPGAIALAPSQSGSFSYFWNIGSTGAEINNLSSGTYYVTITNNTTGCSITKDYFVKNCADVTADFEVAVFGGSALDPNQDINFNLLLKPGPSYQFGTVLPQGFTIEWTAPNGTVLGSGFSLTVDKNVTYNKVIIKVSDGCSTKTIEKTILKCDTQDPELLKNAFLSYIKKPCTGVPNGEIKISVPVLSGTTATVYLNGTPIPISYGNGFATAERNNLFGTPQYNLQITTGACTYQFNFRLGEEETERIYAGVDKFNPIAKCFYDQECYGEPLGEEYRITEIAALDFYESKGGFLKDCTTPIYCDGIKRGEKKFEKGWIKLIEYELLLRNARSVYGGDYIDYEVIPAYELGIGASGEFRARGKQCLSIRYCKGSLKFIQVGLLSEQAPGIPQGGQITVDSRGCFQVPCIFPNKDYAVCPDFDDGGIYNPDPGPPTGPGDVAIVDDTTILERVFERIIADPYQSEELANFAIAQDGILVNPRGIVNTETEQVYDYFNRLNTQVVKDTIYNIEHIIEDWNYEFDVYVESIEVGKESSLTYADSSLVWTNSISSDTLFKVQHLSSIGREISIGGTFAGELTYDSTVIANSDSAACFLLRVSTDGSLQNVHIIKNIDLSNKVAFSENQAGSMVITAKHKGNVEVDSTALTLASTDGYFVLRIDSTDQVQLIKELQGTGNMNLLDVTYSADTLSPSIALAFHGTDTLNADGEFVFADSNSHLNLINISQNGVINWKEYIAADSINLNKFDLTFGEGNNLFAGVTFRDTIAFINHELQSKGGEDLALVKISPNGISEWQRTYGTIENENVSRLLYNYGSLYFGGEFTGSVGDKTIGKYVFSNLVQANTKAYISYILDEAPPAIQQVVLRSKEDEKETINLKPTTAIDVYPNPFNNSFRLRVTGEPVGKVEVANALGQNLLHFNSGNLNDLEVNFNKNGGGLYLVKVYNPSGELIGTKKVVKLD